MIDPAVPAPTPRWLAHCAKVGICPWCCLEIKRDPRHPARCLYEVIATSPRPGPRLSPEVTTYELVFT